MFFDKNNIYSLLYISDSDEEEEKPIKIENPPRLSGNKRYLCGSIKRKDFSRNPYKNYLKYKYSKSINNNFLELEKSINKLVSEYKKQRQNI